MVSSSLRTNTCGEITKKEVIEEFRNQGYSYTKIAKELKISASTVWNRLKKVQEQENV